MPLRTDRCGGPIPATEADEAAHRPRRANMRFAVTWLTFAVLTAVTFSIAFNSATPGDDREAGKRALATTKRLQEHGYRHVGTPQLAAAMGDVQRSLTAVPGVDVTRQRASGTVRLEERDVTYSVSNVIARIAGKSPKTVLVNAHVDAPLESRGAADDAVNVGAMIEAARALSRDRPEHTVVFLFNGGEEAGFTGADAFTRHRWARDVKWYLNMEAIGAGGLPVLFQASANSGGLVDAAGAAPRPLGSVVGQQLFQTGLLNSDTDSRVWREAGWQGIDYAPIGDGYVYHTPLDRVGRIPPGTAQAAVDTVTGVVAELDHPEASPAPYYFDLLNRAWVTFDPVVPVIGSAVLSAALAGLVLLERRRGRVRARAVLLSAGLATGGLLTGIVAGLAVGGLTWLTQGEFSWYGRPWLIGLLHIPAAVAGTLAPLALLRRSGRARASRQEATLTVALGVTAAATVLSCVTAWAGVSAAYLLWTFSALLTLALWVSATLGRRWAAWPVVVAVAAQTLLAAEFVRNIYTLLVPLLGRESFAVPPDVILGALTAVVVFPLALAVAVFAVHAGRPRRAPAAPAALAVVLVTGLVASAVLPPYTPERPKHLILMQEQTAGGTRILLESDGPQSARSLGLLQDAADATGLRVRGDALLAKPRTVPSGRVSFRRPSDRELTIDVGANAAPRVRITLTGPVLSVNGRSCDGQEATVDVVGRPEGFTATVRTGGPVTALVEQTFKGTGADAARVARSMPEWTVSGSRTIVADRFRG